MLYFLVLVIGVLPSLLWLIFYLRKDVHPEPKRLILEVFLYGMLVGFFVIFLGKLAKIPAELLKKSGFPFLSAVFYWFLGVALIEEFLKYWVVKNKILRHPEFDEPTDAMVYMITAGLGFAALENVLIFFRELFPEKVLLFSEEILILLLIRFLSGTFLHALCAGMVGYFLALWKFLGKTKIQIFYGLTLAVLLHGIYDFSIMEIENEKLRVFIPLFVLIFLGFLVSFFFERLRKVSKRNYDKIL